MRDQRWPWLLRLLWLSLPFSAGPAFGDALADTDRAVQVTGTVGLWALWAVTVLLTLVPDVRSLTPLRIIMPGSAAAAAVATIDHGATPGTITALSVTVAVAVVALSPQVGAWQVNGSSYGDERRVPLRPPGQLLLGPIQLAWGFVTATVITAPLLLAATRWVFGLSMLVVGGAISVVAIGALHRLSLRWLVFVPAGIVIHDPMTLAEPVLMKRSAVQRFGPALAETDAIDLTMAALGLALEVRVSSAVHLGLLARPGATAESTEVTAVMISVAQPGGVLDEAERRRIPVG